MTKPKPQHNPHSDHIAAIDLGSNSFHMIVARDENGSLQVIDRLRESVRLGAGLDENNNLNQESQRVALDCLQRFGERLKNIDPHKLRIVGTNTLRNATNSAEFLQQAEDLLGQSVEIISGMEEARLIYLGVTHSLAIADQRRLVMDIGGGSTEFIIGEGFRPQKMESLPMGCVSFTQRFFADGKITKERIEKATLAAMLELEGIAHDYIESGWDQAVGASGSIKAINKVVCAQGWSSDSITRKSLKALRKEIMQADHMDALNLKGLSDERRSVFVAGFVVLHAAFEVLKIDHMLVSDGAVREGLLYDLLGRHKHEDVFETTIANMQQRYHVDMPQAQAVEKTALALLDKAASNWSFDMELHGSLLSWAARLHELGLDIAHNDYHKHGAYIALNADMPGFSLQQQQMLATLIRVHRRKITPELFNSLTKKQRQPVMRLAILLRLAVILQRTRQHLPDDIHKVDIGENSLTLYFHQDWCDSHTLTLTDLQLEAELLKPMQVELSCVCD